MDDAVGTVHGQAFARIFKPKTFEPQDVLHGTLGRGTGTVKDDGRTMVREAFAILDTAMAGKPYAGGNGFGIAACALFTIERWVPQVDIDLPPNLAAHLARMTARPAVQRLFGGGGGVIPSQSPANFISAIILRSDCARNGLDSLATVCGD